MTPRSEFFAALLTNAEYLLFAIIAFALCAIVFILNVVWISKMRPEFTRAASLVLDEARPLSKDEGGQR